MVLSQVIVVCSRASHLQVVSTPGETWSGHVGFVVWETSVVMLDRTCCCPWECPVSIILADLRLEVQEVQEVGCCYLDVAESIAPY